MNNSKISVVELCHCPIDLCWKLQLSEGNLLLYDKKYYYILSYIADEVLSEQGISQEELYFNVYATLLKYGIHLIIKQYKGCQALKLDKDNYNKLVLLLKVYEYIKIEDDLV